MVIFNDVKKLLDADDNYDQLTLGEVVDTNDPQQMGRVRVACPFFGDLENTIIDSIPWASPISPLAGSSSTTTRGRENNRTNGPVAYGMFNTPKVGSYVLVACIEGDPRFRIYLGAMHDQFMVHTLPHGRYTYKKTDDLQDEPSGPLSSTENQIQPLYDTQTDAFTRLNDTTGSGIPSEPRKNFEYRTRGADSSVAGIDSEYIDTEDMVFSASSDDKEEPFTEADGNEVKNTQGYTKSRTQEGLLSSATEFAQDSQVYSWSSPGFHSISMSDSAANCRVRFRTTHGHQIIMDDTNERVYISTAGGKTWIELDEKGNIDIYGERNISVHAEKDINFTAGETFRVKANGIHLISENEVRVHAKAGNLHLKSGGTTEMHSIGNMNMSVPNLLLTAITNIDIKAKGALVLEATGDTSVLAGGILNLKSGSDTKMNAGGNIIQQGAQIHFNGPPAVITASAIESDPTNTFEAWWTSRVPEHEPWARVMTKETGIGSTDNNGVNASSLANENTHENSAEYLYDSTDVGRKTERDEPPFNRNPKWHR